MTVNIFYWELKKQGFGAQGQNNTMVGRQKLNLLNWVFLDFV
jgi:hypothetical protein